MAKPTISFQTAAAFLIAFAGIGLATLLLDPTPLLVEPQPDLDWPLVMLGMAAGLWAAYRITRLVPFSKNTLGKVALLIILPLILAAGLKSFGDRVQEAISFRQGGQSAEISALVVSKETSTSRKGRIRYSIGIINPFGAEEIAVPVDEPTFTRAAPLKECVTLLIERAPNGVVRLLSPLRWNSRCPAHPA